MRTDTQGQPGCLAIAVTVMMLGIGPMVTPAAGSGQIVENPAKPKAANAGRVIVPEEVLAISDEGTSDYYFKRPYGLSLGPDSELFVRDWDQVLRFDKNGKFRGNLFKKGQGPGEMQNAGMAVATEKGIAVYSGYPSKLVFFDRTGQFEKEVAVRQEGRRILNLIGRQADQFYFVSWEFPRTTGDPDVVDNPRTIVAVGELDGAITSLATFVTRAWVLTSPDGSGGMFDVSTLIATPFQDDLLALTHTEEYLIKLFDPTANKVVREFHRAYPRIKGEPLTEAEKKGGIGIGDKRYTRPERKFENDVKNLFARDGEIWAVTSTTDKAKGVLVDVFGEDGVYRDCFWLKLPEAASKSLSSPGQSALDGEFIWVVEKAEDETSAIKKYRVGLPQAKGTAPPGTVPPVPAMREDKEGDMRSDPRRPA